MSTDAKDGAAELALDPTERALVREALGLRPIEKTLLEEHYEDLDAFMAEGAGERPWQHFELTQREDVMEWIRDPARILKIQAALGDLARHLSGLPRPVRILDAGCYGGYLYDFLAARCFEDPSEFAYVGVDVDERSVEAAALVHRDAANATFARGDVYALEAQFGPRAFDVVFCSRVLIHIPYFERAVQSLYAVTRRLTHIVLEVSDRPLVQRILRHNTETGEEHHHYYFRKYSREELARAAQAVGADHRIIHGPDPYSTYLLIR